LEQTVNIASDKRSVQALAPLCSRISLSPLALVLGLAVAIGATPNAVSAQELPCAVWVVRNALQSPEAWREALAAVERAGCGRMYLQVSGRWDALYPSHVFVPPATPPRGWEDPLADALAEAHARGIEVHAWVNALLAWSAPDAPPDPNHVWHRHPDWFVSRAGRSMRELSRGELDRAGLVGEGWFLDPSQTGVRTELRRLVLELVTRYPVDGVHLDYIRYPSGWAPADASAHVTRLVALIRADLAKAGPQVALSAAVMPVPGEARETFGQDWADWLDRGLVEAAAPMVYRETPSSIEDVVRAWPATVPRDRIWVGVRIDRIGPKELAETARRLADEGVAGVALFSHNLLLDDPAWSR
jgi:uncharacterized lipoprotein YddW (UPF0748 family)